jgi:hypothetical protein
VESIHHFPCYGFSPDAAQILAEQAEQVADGNLRITSRPRGPSPTPPKPGNTAKPATCERARTAVTVRPRARLPTGLSIALLGMPQG